MKNLPDTFPIRYAIIVNSWVDEDFSEEQKLYIRTTAKSEMLFRQLLTLLQKEPLSEKLLIPEQETIKFRFMGVEVINIAKLNAPLNWAEKLKPDIKKIIPEAKYCSTEKGTAFNLGLYSYKGAVEIPSFVKAHNILVKHNNNFQTNRETVPKFGHIENISDIRFLYSNYEKIKNNKITNFQLYEAMTKYTKPIYISTPYSKIWEILDNGFNEGILSVNGRSDKDIIKKRGSDEKKYNYGKKEIMVAICKSWEELFAEKILSIYKMLNFCNNCGIALPFDYQGKYCPDTKKNKGCKRERAKKRARKKSQV